MNKYEESYKNISTYKNLLNMCGKSMMELKELVEKETPKMVIIAKYSGTYIPPKCSVCGNSILNYGQHYCEDCGHKLDYPNEDENQMRLL